MAIITMTMLITARLLGPRSAGSFIWLQYSCVWACACLSVCVCVCLRRFFFFFFFHISVCIYECVIDSVCACVCVFVCVIASNLFVRQGNYFRLWPNARMFLVIYKTSD